MTIKDVLIELGINKNGTYSRDGSFVIDLEEDSNEFGKIYSILDKNPDVEYMESNSLLTIDNSSLYYKYKDFQINILADFNNDEYKVVIARL